MKCGICSGDSVLNIALCMLGYLPGLLHAWYIIAKFPEPVNYYGAYDSENGRVRYVVIDQDDEEEGGRGGRRSRQHRTRSGQQARTKPNSQAGRHAHMSYGTGSEDSAAAGSSSPAPAPAPASASAPLPPQPHDYNAGEGSSEDFPPPPSYAQVMGDNKIQDRS